MQPIERFPQWTGHVRAQVWRKVDGFYQLIEERAGYNARTDAGASAVAQALFNTQPAIFKYIAYSADATAIAKGDVALPGEITTGGLARTAGTFGGYTAPSALNGAFSCTVSVTNTTTASYTIQKLGLFNAASGPTLLSEYLFGSPITGLSGDVVTTTWTIGA